MLGRRKVRYNVIGCEEQKENARGMEGHCDRTNVQREGDIHECGNYRGIKMICHTKNMWKRIIDSSKNE